MPPRTEGGRERWALTAGAFERLLALLGPDRDSGALRYEAIRRKLTRVFEWRGFPNAEELADATFDRVARKAEQGLDLYASDAYSYLHGVALRIAQEQARAGLRVSARPEPLADSHAAAAYPLAAARAVEEASAEQRLQCLDECLAALPADGAELLRRYHGGAHAISARRALARDLGISATALRLRAFRLRAGLQECVSSCCRRSAAETEASGSA